MGDLTMDKATELRNALTEAGVGRKMHDRSLSEFPPVVAWFGPDGSIGLSRLCEGQTLNLVGGLKATEAAVICARAVIVMGKWIKVIGWYDMLDVLNDEGPGGMFERLESAIALVLIDVPDKEGREKNWRQACNFLMRLNRAGYGLIVKTSGLPGLSALEGDVADLLDTGTRITI
jgi:hypothetical protein